MTVPASVAVAPAQCRLSVRSQAHNRTFTSQLRAVRVVEACSCHVHATFRTVFVVLRHLFLLLRTEAGVATDHKPKRASQSMFQKLGGTAAIQGVVDEFYTRVFADNEVKGFFEGIDKRKLKAHQVETPTRGLQASLQ